MLQGLMEMLSPRALRERLEASAGAVVRQSPWDRRALPVLLAGALLLVFDAVYIQLTNLSFQTELALEAFALLLWLLFAALLARHYGLTKIGDTLLGIALPVLFGAVAVVLIVILTRHSWPFADERLLSMDRSLGLNWLGLLEIYRDNPSLTIASRFAYRSMISQLPIITVLLFLTGRNDRAWAFVNAWAIALLAATFIHPFFTATGPYLQFGISPFDFPGQRMVYPWTTGPLIDAIRSHEYTDVVGSMGGLVFFPSFHTAAGVMFIWASWEYQLLRWLFAPLNLLMISACPIIGAHYISDVVAGAIVGILAILIARWLVRRIGAPVPIGARPQPG